MSLTRTKGGFSLSITPIQLTFKDGHPFANSQYFEYGDYHLHYRIDPAKDKEKAKLFMIHGFLCDTTFYDELVEEYTAAGLKCVRVDLPDFGFSTRETKRIKYVPQIEILFALMDELDTDGTGWIVVGHSMGGSITLEMADQDAGRFRAIILNAPFLMQNTPGIMGPFLKSRPVTKAMDTVFKFASQYDILWKLLCFVTTFNVGYSLKFDPGKFATPFTVEQAGDGICYMTAKNRTPALKELPKRIIPTQLVTGQLDIFFFPNKARRLRNSLPEGYEWHVMKRGGHCFLQDKAKKTAKLGLAFLNKNGIL